MSPQFLLHFSPCWISLWIDTDQLVTSPEQHAFLFLFILAKGHVDLFHFIYEAPEHQTSELSRENESKVSGRG